MRCPNCEHENPKDARFCEDCGSVLDVGGTGTGLSWVLPVVFLVMASAIAVLLMQVFKSRNLVAEGDGISPGQQTTPHPYVSRPTLVSSDLPIAKIEGFAPLTVKLQPVSFEKPSEFGDLIFEWEFAPGVNAFKNETSGRATYVYSEPGMYHPKLTISDESGEVARQVWEIIVLPERGAHVMNIWQADPRSGAANLETAKLYYELGADNPALYYALRSYLADDKNPETITLLADGFEKSGMMDEYLHHVLSSGTEIAGEGDRFAERLNGKMSQWGKTSDKRLMEIQNSEARPTRSSIYTLLLALSALHDYKGAIKAVEDNNLSEDMLENMAWYSLNTGRIDDAGKYAKRWLSKHPNDPYALEYLMIVAAIDDDLPTARDYLRKYMATSPKRGHIVSVVMDLIILTENGLSTDFVWEVTDALHVFM